VPDNLKKLDIIKDLSVKVGYSSSYSKKLVNDLIDIISENIKYGHLNLKNVGSFKIISKKERIGRNPKTKKEYVVSQRKSVSFKPSKSLLVRINKFI
tara:strand:- start:606 stop:896 length:291 start_codon:yes stop_codon:yes gene_type:complete